MVLVLESQQGGEGVTYLENEMTDEEILQIVGNRADIGDSVRIARAIEAKIEAKLREQEPLTDTFVQKVPDHCDRVLWRSWYIHLDALTPAHPAPIPEGFDAWSLNPYTIALQKSIAEDYIPKPPMAAARSVE